MLSCLEFHSPQNYIGLWFHKMPWMCSPWAGAFSSMVWPATFSSYPNKRLLDSRLAVMRAHIVTGETFHHLLLHHVSSCIAICVYRYQPYCCVEHSGPIHDVLFSVAILASGFRAKPSRRSSHTNLWTWFESVSCAIAWTTLSMLRSVESAKFWSGPIPRSSSSFCRWCRSMATLETWRLLMTTEQEK